MRRLAFVTAALLACTAVPAAAADMALKAPAPAAPAAEKWTGFYIGVHGGGDWANLNVASELSFRPTCFVFGGQAGYNWQYGNFVVGPEIDLSYMGCKDSVSMGEESSIAAKLDYLGSARVRVGYLLTPSLLLFGTGGAGFGHAKLEVPGLVLGNSYFGPVAGGGLEYMLTRNLTIRAEGFHYWFGDGTVGPIPASMQTTVARGAINLKF